MKKFLSVLMITGIVLLLAFGINNQKRKREYVNQLEYRISYAANCINYFDLADTPEQLRTKLMDLYQRMIAIKDFQTMSRVFVDEKIYCDDSFKFICWVIEGGVTFDDEKLSNGFYINQTLDSGELEFLNELQNDLLNISYELNNIKSRFYVSIERVNNVLTVFYKKYSSKEAYSQINNF